MITVQLADQRLDQGRDLVRAFLRPVRPVRQPGQPGQPFGQIPGHSGMDRLVGHLDSCGHLGDLRPGQNRAHCIQPLLDH
jgi:hypothetical protein